MAGALAHGETITSLSEKQRQTWGVLFALASDAPENILVPVSLSMQTGASLW